MTEWVEKTLGEIGHVVTGRTPPTSNPENYGGDVPFVTPTDMDGRRYIDATGRTLTNVGLSTVWKAEIPKESVLVSCIGSDMGKAAMAAFTCVTNQQINSIIVGSECDSKFVYYNLRARKEEIRLAAGGSAQPILNKSAFSRLILILPPFKVQKGIASVLSCLDDKIELNRRMNETLEAMARAIFKDWFVDFGPAHAKAEGRAPYLAPEIWDLFPDALDDEDKPIGWCHWALADLATHHRPTVSPSAEPKRVFEHYSIPAFDAGQEPALDAGSSIKSNKTTVPVNAVLLSKLNPDIPRVWIPNPPDDRPQVASTEFLAFTPKPPANRSVLYCLFRDTGFRREMEAMVTGTSKSHQRVSPKALVERQVLHGANDMFEKFDKRASPLLARVLKNRQESSTLAQTRDLLLPKLMSGEIRLAKAQKAMEAVA